MAPGNTRCLANCTGGPSKCFKAQLEAVNYKKPPWSVRFPELVDIFTEGDPCMPVDNDISDNIYCHEGSLNRTGPLGFTNVDAATVRSWSSTMSNNQWTCQKLDGSDAAASKAASAYFVDSDSGSDSRSGHLATEAWRSHAPVRSVKLQPNDSVRFNRGGVLRADDSSLKIIGAGAPGAPVTFTSYGELSAPKPLLLDQPGETN